MEQKVQTFLDLAKERNELQAAWNRQLLNLAAGGLALLVGLSPEVPDLGPARYFLTASWIALGIGIVFGAGATYSEVSLAQRLAAKFQGELLKEMRGHAHMSDGIPISANPHWFFLRCRTVMVVSLLVAVVSLVVYACFVTLQ